MADANAAAPGATAGSAAMLLRQVNSQTLMQLIIHEGPLTRVELADRSGLSKQTVSEIVRGLETAGWVREAGRITGRIGRSPVRYEFHPRSGYVIGIDLGATTLEAAITDLSGEILHEASTPIDRRGGRHLIERIDQVVRDLARRGNVDWSQVRMVSLGTPGVIDPATGVMRYASNVPGFGNLHLRDELSARLGVPMLIDNEVNLSVLGEQWQGHGQGCRDFLFFNIGTGCGMGVVLDDEIHRGSTGAAGELAFLPLGGDPYNKEEQTRGVYENQVGAPALLRRYAEAGGTADDVPALFAAAANGEPRAQEALEEQARLLALGIAAAASLLDPELVVLGGGIGTRTELLDPVRRWLDRLTSRPPRLRTSALGNRAALVGALAAALAAAHENLFGAPVRRGSLPIPQPAATPAAGPAPRSAAAQTTGPAARQAAL